MSDNEQTALDKAEAAIRDAAAVREAWNLREPQLFAAERERDELAAKNLQITREWSEQVASLRSQVVRLERDAYLGDDDEKRHLRAEVNRLCVEANDWMRDWEVAVEASKKLRAELAAAQEDTKRLDWLLENGYAIKPDPTAAGFAEAIYGNREEIDAARKPKEQRTKK